MRPDCLTELSSRALVSRVHALGADLAGVVSCEPLEKEARDLERWLELAYCGNMAYMDLTREVRKDPARLLPNCRSIIVIAVNYYYPHARLNVPNFPKVSRYAWGGDYHEVLGGILRELAREIDAAAATAGKEKVGLKWVVDSGPFREKVWAQRAGLGWIGRHTLLVTPSFGSWVFIGALLTTLDLEPTSSAPYQDNCGDCLRCVEACPTGALVKPGQLDARACISYLTVAHDGPIPGQLVEQLSGWVFGCDICQEVCPWNQSAKPARLKEFHPRPALMVPDLHLWAQMSEQQFIDIAKGTALWKAGKERLRRNALAVMGLL